MEIFISVVLIVKAFLMELSARRPLALVILNKMTNLFGSFIYLSLKVS
jgi:chaperone required for assembly of F1-ATPase